jgi:hypothetical protein
MPNMYKANQKNHFVHSDQSCTSQLTTHLADIHSYLLQKELNSLTATIDNEESELGYSYVSVRDKNYLHHTLFGIPENPGHYPLFQMRLAQSRTSSIH